MADDRTNIHLCIDRLAPIDCTPYRRDHYHPPHRVGDNPKGCSESHCHGDLRNTYKLNILLEIRDKISMH